MGSSYTPNFLQLPETIQNLVRAAVADLSPREVILFGSRARGSQRENSDFDICLKGASPSQELRAKFRLRVDEDTLTLHKVDLVFWEDLNDTYVQNINAEGVLLYGN